MTKRTGTPRDRINHLQVVVNGDERRCIQVRAAAAGLSVSGYLRTAGLNEPIRSAVANHEAIKVLAKLNADLGLLKLRLADRPDCGAAVGDVRALLDRIGEMQGRLAEIARRL
jgi:hypothetical protein